MSAKTAYDILSGIIGENAPERDQSVDIWLNTGLAELNRALSGSYDGGFPVGRMVEIYGPESSGKTFIATQCMIAAQQASGIAGFNDHERSFDVKLAKAMGLKTDLNGTWIYRRPKTFEESVDIAIMAATAIRDNELIPKDAPIVWVFDSVPSMIPSEVLFTKDAKGNLKRRESSDHNMRTKLALAAATSIHYPILAQFAEDNNMLCLMLNQIRLDPTVTHGNPEKTPGGNAGKFYPSIRVSLGRTMLDNGLKGDKREIHGQKITAVCVKNKVTRPFGKASWDVLFNTDGPGCTVDRIGSMVDYLIKLGSIPLSGGWIEWEGKKTHRKTLVELLKTKFSEEEAMAKLESMLPELANPDVGDVALAGELEAEMEPAGEE